ncbi:MAG: hypothetical protein IKA81_01910 [Alistipes sp.]|nr:hypothetical protein [Alistipes sp.]
MKRIFIVLVAMFITFPVIADNPTNKPADIVILPQKPKIPSSTTRPLSFVAPDIEATYYMEAITFVFNADLGNCIIDVININTGDTRSASYDGIGSTSLYLSGDSGNYMIYIDTENGAYTGEFVL